MGKGKTGCAEASLSASFDQELSLLELRRRWQPFLERRAAELIEQSELLDSLAGKAILDEQIEFYASGGGGPDFWLTDCLARVRVQLSSLLFKEQHPQGVSRMLMDDSVDPEQALDLLRGFAASSADSDERSRYRHIAAGLLYHHSRDEEARAELQDDLSDLHLSDKRRALTELKLTQLAPRQTRSDWAYRMVPPDVITSSFSARGAFTMFASSTPGSRDRLVGGVGIMPHLSSHGYHREALEIGQQLIKDNLSGGGLWHNARCAYGQALVAAGRLDQAAEFHRSVFDQRPEGGKLKIGGMMSDTELTAVVDMCDEADLPQLALAASRERRDKADSLQRESAQRDYSARLIRMGMVDQALLEIDEIEPDPEHASGLKASLLSSAVAERPPRDVRSQLRHRLSAVLFDSEYYDSALQVMHDELSDPGLSSAAVELADLKIAEIERHL